ETQAKAGNLDLDLKTRDTHIEKLRTQQQVAKTNKEYQTFLVEINTMKLDKAKVEEETLKVMESAEKQAAEVKELSASLESEQSKLATLKQQIGGQVAALEAEVNDLKPARAEAE